MIRDEILTAVKKASGETQIQLEIPENEDFGDYSSNIAMAIFSKFQIPNSKFQKNSKLKISKYKTPRDIAEDIVKQLKTEKNITGIVDKIEVAGPGFINFFLSNKALLLELQKVIKEANQYGSANIGKGKNILVEYSSPNIAKYFGIGHLRSTIIGQALYNLYKFLGYKTIGDNHIGDWGTQFGAILAQIQSSKFPGLAKRSGAGKIQNLNMEKLEMMYVNFHKKAEDNPKLWEEARRWFKKLEQGDKNAREIWNSVRKLSLTEFDRIYQILGVKIDNAHGESFYEDKMQSVISDVRVKGLSKKSEGAEIVEFGPPARGLPPAMLLKTDGTTTYYTRDLATIKFRLKEWNPSLIIYEVGSEQSLHFKQVFETAKMLGWLNGTKLVHVAHGLIRLPHGKMATRLGQSVRLEEILNEAIKRAGKIIEESETPRLVRLSSPSSIRSGQAGRGFSKREKEKIAKSVGIGAIKYFDLMHNPTSDIIFNWEKMFVLEGNSAPYLQYTVARTNSVTRKVGMTNDKWPMSNSAFSIQHLALNAEELALMRSFIHFPEVIEDAARNYSPNLLCNYLFALAQKFNNFYNKHRIIESNVKSQMSNVARFRLALTFATGQILKNGLNILGIDTPTKM